MSEDFYKRSGARHLDGTLIFKTAEDEQNEKIVADLLTAAWGVTLHPFALLSPVDWFAEREGRVVGVLELKCRSHESTKYPTVFLSFRKWLVLTLSALGLNVPAIFVVRFTDAVRWIEIARVHHEGVEMGGCSRIFSSRANIEPVIEVPIADMHELISREGNNATD